MRRSVRLIAGLAGLLLPLVACSLLVETGGLGDGAATAGDAATDTAVAMTDAPVLENAETSVDAATDAPADAPDGGPKCVDGPTRFCDDFDSPLPGSKWSSTSKTRGEVSFDDGGVSPPLAMHATVKAGGGNAEAQLIKELPASSPHVHCDLDMKLDAVPATGEVDILSVITRAGGVDRHQVYMATFSGVWSLAEFAADQDGGPALDRTISIGASLPNATWFHVVIDVTPTAATLTADGHFIKLDNLTTPTGTNHNVQVGVNFTSGDVQSGGVYIDNVDCTFPN
jgi:hypothetical protein